MHRFPGYGTGIKPATPVHMVNEFGHVVGVDEFPMTPHHTNVHTPADSPVLTEIPESFIMNRLIRGLSLLDPEAELDSADQNNPVSITNPSANNNDLTEMNRDRALSLGSATADSATRSGSEAESEASPSDASANSVKSTTSLPVTRNPPNSLADNISHASSHASSISSWIVPRNGKNTPVNDNNEDNDEKDNNTPPRINEKVAAAFTHRNTYHIQRQEGDLHIHTIDKLLDDLEEEERAGSAVASTSVLRAVRERTVARMWDLARAQRGMEDELLAGLAEAETEVEGE